MMTKVSQNFEQAKQKLLALPAVKTGQQWYGAKNKQEQLILKALAAFVALMLFVLIIVLPIINSAEQSQKKLDKNIKLYDSLASNAGRFASGAGGSQSGPILPVVTSQAKLRNLSLKRFEPDGDKLKVWFEDASFDSAISLIEELVANHGIQIEQINVDRSEGSGRADIRATLTR